MSDVTTKLERIFGDLLAQEAVPIRSMTRVSCPNWDSLLQLNLILAIEQEFAISLTDDEAIDLNSFDSALQIVEDKIAEQQNQRGSDLPV